MSDTNHDEMLSEFTVVTGVTEERAKFYLESANWNLQVKSKCVMKCASHTQKHSIMHMLFAMQKFILFEQKYLTHVVCVCFMPVGFI